MQVFRSQDTSPGQRTKARLTRSGLWRLPYLFSNVNRTGFRGGLLA
jgi:hypothetical protein